MNDVFPSSETYDLDPRDLADLPDAEKVSVKFDASVVVLLGDERKGISDALLKGRFRRRNRRRAKHSVYSRSNRFSTPHGAVRCVVAVLQSVQTAFHFLWNADLSYQSARNPPKTAGAQHSYGRKRVQLEKIPLDARTTAKTLGRFARFSCRKRL